MKMRKRLAALGVAAAMVAALFVGTTVTAFADTPYSITINTPTDNGLTDAGQVFTAYKIFDLTTAGDPATAFSYTIDPAFAAFNNYPGAPTPPDTTGVTLYNYITGLTDDSADMNTLSANLWAYIQNPPAGNPPFVTGTATGSGTAGDPGFDTTTINNLDQGYYLVYGTATTPSDGTTNTVVAACALTSTAPQATVDLKADAPSITKQVMNDNSGLWDTWTDNQIGTSADFRLSSAVPKMTGYKTYLFTVHDTMSTGLTFDPNSVVVTIGGDVVDPVNYEIITAADDTSAIDSSKVTNYLNDPTIDPDTFQIMFDPVWFVTQSAGAPIIVTYSAEVNDQAVVASKGNPNTVNLEYSDSPYDQYVPGSTHFNGTHHGKSGHTPKTTVTVYTYYVNIVKDNGKNTDLADAHFILLPGTDSGLAEANTLAQIPSNQDVNTPSDAINFTGPTTTSDVTDKNGDATTANQYTVADSTATDTTTDIVSPSTGQIDLQGLDAGTYYLVETQSPSGYNKLTTPIVITITSTAPDTTGTTTGDANFTVAYQTDSSVQNQGTSTNGNNSFIIEVINNTGNIFPSTGGIGTTIFYAGGAVVMCLAVAGLILVNVRRKKRTANSQQG